MASKDDAVPHVNTPFEAISYRLFHALPVNNAKRDKLENDPVSQSEWMFRANSYRSSAEDYMHDVRQKVWMRNVNIAVFFGLVGVVLYVWK